MTERADIGESASSLNLSVADVAQAAAGASGDKTWSYSPGYSGSGYGSLLLAIALSPPTLTAASPSYDSIDGGRTVTLTGTGFSVGATPSVTIGGTAATGETVVNDTTMTCVAPAHAAGTVDIVVTSDSGSATLTNGFKFVSVKDSVVKLVKGGTVSGNNNADTATLWPLDDGSAIYGGPTDMWGLTLTPAQVNAADFGVVLQATVTGEADVNEMKQTVYFTVPGSSDVASMTSVLHVATDRQTVTPKVFKLPRYNLSAADDPNLNLARDDAVFQTYRHSGPARNLDKAWDIVDFYAEMSNPVNGPDVTVDYSLNDEDWEPILDSTGATLVVNDQIASGAGMVRGYFPRETAWAHSNHNTIAFRFTLEDTSGARTSTLLIRDLEAWGWYRPSRVGDFDLTLSLGELLISGGELLAKGVQQQIRDLEEAVGRKNLPVPYHSPENRDGFVVIKAVDFKEGWMTDGDRQYPIYLAHVSGEWAT